MTITRIDPRSCTSPRARRPSRMTRRRRRTIRPQLVTRPGAHGSTRTRTRRTGRRSLCGCADRSGPVRTSGGPARAEHRHGSAQGPGNAAEATEDVAEAPEPAAAESGADAGDPETRTEDVTVTETEHRVVTEPADQAVEA